MSPWVPPSGPPPDDGPGPAEEWLLCDAWFLAALRVTGTPVEPARLADVLIAADAVNGLVLSQGEIEHALGRLVPAGLVDVDDRGFACTPAGRALVALTRGSAARRHEGLLHLLRSIEVEPELWDVDPDEYSYAVLQHRATVREGLRREMRPLWRR